MRLLDIFLALILAGTLADARPWTAKNGKVIDAEYVAVSPDGKEVALRLPGGRIVRTVIGNLSEADQALIEKIKLEGPDAIPREVDYGDIDPAYLPPSPWPVVQYRDPGGWNTIDVSKHGLKPDSDVDAAEAIAKIIESTEGRRRLFFPAGTYTLKSNLVISEGDLWLDGVGKETAFVLDFADGTHVHGITIKGSQEQPHALARIPKRGDESVELEAPADLEVGDLVRVYHDVKDNRGIGFTRGQLSWVTGVDGRTVTLDLKIGADLADKSLLRRVRPLRNVRCTNFSLTRLHQSNMGDHNLQLELCANAEVRKVDCSKARSWNIRIHSCRDVIATECTLHDLWVRKGFNGYGITVEQSTGVNVVNNHGYDLRHHFELAWGTSYSVVAYNTTEGPYDYCDFGSHHADLGYCNLFEGNRGQDVVLDWGESRWNAYTFFYRNQASRRIGSYRPKRAKHHFPVYLANENTCKDQINMPRVGAQEAYIGANIVKGELQWGDVKEGSRLPPSLFLRSKPSYLGDKPWPLFGPRVDGGDSR